MSLRSCGGRSGKSINNIRKSPDVGGKTLLNRKVFCNCFKKNEAVQQLFCSVPVSDHTTAMNYEQQFSDADKDRIIQMAWEDRTPFEAIAFQFGLREKEVIEFMRKYSLPSSFKMWRKRMAARKTKHRMLRSNTVNRFKCSRQRESGNKIAKR